MVHTTITSSSSSSSSSSTTTVLDSPQKKIHDLVAAAKIHRDASYTPKQYVRSAQSILNSADTARVRGDMEGAFVLYLKATTIVLEVVTQDKDFEKFKTDQEYVTIKKRIIELFSDTEKIKDLLLAKYQSIQDIEASALATAAKAGRPKPPPRPSKPEFLSSSRYDGQAPIADTSPHMGPAFSASTTPASSFSSTLPQQTAVSSYPVSMPNLQASIGSMSMTPPKGMASAPPPTSLASYRPLQPTTYGAPSSSSSPVFQPSTISPTNMYTNTSGPASTTYPTNGQAIPPTSGAGYSSLIPSRPVPMPRTAHAVMPPASAPAAIPNGKISDIMASSDTAPQGSSNTTTTTSRNNENNGGKYPFPLSIKPQRLLDYMRQQNSPSLLLIDVRMQVQYKDARVKAPAIVNIEPPALRDGVSAKVIADQGLFNNPPEERALFADRAKFALIIYYDQNSSEMPTSGPMSNLFRALHDLEFEKPLYRRPVFLVGGFDAWLECAGMKWVEGTGVDAVRRLGQPSPPLSDGGDTSSLTSQDERPHTPGSVPGSHQPQDHSIYTKLSKGGGINRHDGRIIRRNIEDYIKRDEGPQSMVNPRIGPIPSNLPSTAYPPRATPHTNINASSYPPPSSNFDNSIPSGGYGSAGQQPSGQLDYSAMGMNGQRHRNDSMPGQLNRRHTIYDDHWNNFGSGEKSHTSTVISPPVPEKIPISGASMSTSFTDTGNTTSGPGVPMMQASSSTIRPPVPSRPMRPLPQPPGMNDLKDYTKFGSGFSKIGGSQLGKTGLTNLGNTCFMNSVIQCLIATPPLSRYFLDGSFKRHINLQNPLGTQGKLADAFSDLIRSMWSGQSLVVSPTSFRYAIGGFAPQFKGTEQHDSQEFLSFLLDGLHEDLKAKPRLAPPGEDEGSEADDARMEALPEFDASEIAWQRYLRRDNSIVVNLFQGQFKNRLCCSKCGKTSTTYNAFMYLALPIKDKSSGRQPQTLLSCLNAFVEPEVMEGDNAWNCPHCKKPRKATKQLTISRVPDVLLIQLKRFSSDGPFKNKIKAMVQYPILDLDLTSYLPKRSDGGAADPAIYDLYAVSNHSGEVSSGHYTACVRGESPNSWINFDDSRVSPCDKSVAVSEHGYTLFYVRRK
ncbi:ubiquitin-specific protease doa4 [Mortierella claussenii]|nr:ubiquitin-specific protease doa4 [Mortierella claussenii]